MTELSAPYRFVPLSRYILRPGWAGLVSHDHPFRDGVCGELSLTLTTHTPLCVGGRQQPPTKTFPGKVHFFRTPEGQLAIPGSSLKGMLRTVMEIACFGHFKQVEDQRLGVRDISTANNFYSKAMNRSQVFAGWLNFSNGKWVITPCSYVRLHQEQLIDHFSISKSEWSNYKQAYERYEKMGGLLSLSFNTQPYPYDCKKEAVNLGSGEHEGTLVMTGQPGKAFDQGRGAKKREFIFHDARPDDARIVNSKVMQGFMHIHAESSEWQYWKDLLATPSKLKPGVPVFFHTDAEGEVKSLGLSRMYKLPYTHSLHEAIGHTQPEHLDARAPDLPGLVFGWLDEHSSQNNLRGRVTPGMLSLEGETATSLEGPMVMSSPKPTFYPAYIKQPDSQGRYNTLMDSDAELAGWKRYPVRPGPSADIPELAPKVVDNKNVQVYLDTVPAETIFTGRLRFHNLRLVELGALLWCIDFGHSSQHRHALGVGKPHGFGQVSLGAQPATLRHNDPAQASIAPEKLLEAARFAFVQYMDEAWQKATLKPEVLWQESPQVVHLLAMADPGRAQRADLTYYPEPKQFMTAKKEELRFASYSGEDLLPADVVPEQALKAPDDGVDDLDVLLEKAGQALEAQRQDQKARDERVKREIQKQSMTSEQKRVAELEDLLAKEDAVLTKTELEKIPKIILALHDEICDWNEEELAQILLLAERSEELGVRMDKKKIIKAARKIAKKLSSSSN